MYLLLLLLRIMCMYVHLFLQVRMPPSSHCPGESLGSWGRAVFSSLLDQDNTTVTWPGYMHNITSQTFHISDECKRITGILQDHILGGKSLQNRSKRFDDVVSDVPGPGAYNVRNDVPPAGCRASDPEKSPKVRHLIELLNDLYNSILLWWDIKIHPTI